MRHIFGVFVSVLAVIGSAPLAASAKAAVLPVKTILASSAATSGSQITGPTKIVLSGINPLRYIPTVSVTVSSTPGPVPSFLPSATTSKGMDHPSTLTDDAIKANLGNVLQYLHAAHENYYAASAVVDQVVGGNALMANDELLSEILSITKSSEYNAAVVSFGEANITSNVYDPMEIAKYYIAGLPSSDTQKVVLQAEYDDANAQFQAITPLVERFHIVVALFGAKNPEGALRKSYVDDCSERRGNTTTTTKVVFTLTPVDKNDATVSAISDDVSVVCESPIAISGGFVFSSLPQRSYTALTSNAAGMTSASSSTATVQESANASVRVVPFGFVHVRLNQDAERAWFFTFGVGINSNSGSSSTSSTIDYASGISYGLARYVFLTAGAHLGQVTTAASGYSVGSPVAVGASIPTQTRTQIAPFIGISFGSH